jgi:hypothetical protein
LKPPLDEVFCSLLLMQFGANKYTIQNSAKTYNQMFLAFEFRALVLAFIPFSHCCHLIDIAVTEMKMPFNLRWFPR